MKTEEGNNIERRKKRQWGSGIALEKSAEHPCLLGKKRGSRCEYIFSLCTLIHAFLFNQTLLFSFSLSFTFAPITKYIQFMTMHAWHAMPSPLPPARFRLVFQLIFTFICMGAS